MQHTWLGRLAVAVLLVSGAFPMSNVPAQTAPLHETRAVWFATVLFDGNWPESQIDPAAKQEADLRARIRTAAANGINTFIFQVVARGDAMYASERLPWSDNLRGPGQDPGYDPLAVAVDEAHKLGIELHAWVNVFRIGDETTVDDFVGAEPAHVAHSHPEWVKNFNGQLWLDPSSPEARQWMIDNILEIVRNYDVDGIHYDFIRYPQTGFQDDLQSCQFQTGSCPDIDQWRRDNVSAFVEEAQAAIHGEKSWVKIGATPIGHYDNDYAWGHLSGYHDVFQASREWGPGWVDYLAPQVYWSIGQEYDPPRFEVLAEEWVDESNDTPVFVGIAAYGADSTASTSPFPPSDLTDQIAVTRDVGAKGQVFFRYDHFLKYIAQIRSQYPHKALPAEMTHRFYHAAAPSAPADLELRLVGSNSVQLSWTPSEGSAENPVRGYAIFRNEGSPPDVENAEDLLATVGATTFSDERPGPAMDDRYYTVVALSSLGSTSPGSEAVSTASLGLAADPALPGRAFRMLSIYPNPTTAHATVEFELDAPADVTIQVFDALGRVVVRGFEGYLAGGRHEAQLDLTDLSAGTYLVEIRTKSGQIVRQIVKL